MFSDDDASAADRMYRSGCKPSEVLRFFACSKEGVTSPHLMKLAERAFSLPFESVQCIAGWWYDGTGELSDEQLDRFLVVSIKRTLDRRSFVSEGAAKSRCAGLPKC